MKVEVGMRIGLARLLHKWTQNSDFNTREHGMHVVAQPNISLSNMTHPEDDSSNQKAKDEHGVMYTY